MPIFVKYTLMCSKGCTIVLPFNCTRGCGITSNVFSGENSCGKIRKGKVNGFSPFTKEI